MQDIYIKLVKAGKRTIESVPQEFQQQVREALGL